MNMISRITSTQNFSIAVFPQASLQLQKSKAPKHTFHFNLYLLSTVKLLGRVGGMNNCLVHIVKEILTINKQNQQSVLMDRIAAVMS